MIEDMAELHITEAEVVKDFAAVLEKVRHGAEVIVERDHQPAAVIKFPDAETQSFSIFRVDSTFNNHTSPQTNSLAFSDRCASSPPDRPDRQCIL